MAAAIAWVLANPITVTMLGLLVAVIGGVVLVTVRETRQERAVLAALRRHHDELDRLRREAAALRGED